MNSWLHPALFFFAGSLLLPFFRGQARKAILLLIPVLAIIAVALAEQGIYGQYRFLNVNGVFGRVDKLSLIFAWVFTIMAFLGALYALHVKESGHHIAGFLYVGSSLGAVFAARLFHFVHLLGDHGLFLCVPSSGIKGQKKSLDRGICRYLLVHVFGGLLFLRG